MLRQLLSRVQASLKTDHFDGEFSDELETHLSLLRERFESQVWIRKKLATPLNGNSEESFA